MHFFRRALGCTALAALAAPSALAAQDREYPAVILRLPASARSLAMGNVAIAGRDDDVLFYNPAQLVAARGTSVSIEQFSSSARAGAFSSVSRLNSGGIAIGATVAEFNSPGGVFPVGRDAMVKGGPNAGTSSTFALGIGQVIKGTRIGGAVKFVDERIGPSRNDGGVLDLGVGRDVFGYSLGLAVQNIGGRFGPTFVPASNFFPPGSGPVVSPLALPLRVTFGAGRGIPAGPFDVAATAAVSWLRDGFFTPAAGGEIGYSWLDGYNVILRAGVRRPERGEGALTAGAGYIMDRLSIDYAMEMLSGSRLGHRVGLRIR